MIYARGIAAALALCCLVACDRLSADVDESESAVERDCSLTMPLSAPLDSIWQETQECTGLSAPEPRVFFSPAVACPGSDAVECLAVVPPFSCEGHPLLYCGALGRYLRACAAIELPEGSTIAAAHEMIHHLKLANGHSDWNRHTGPEWACDTNPH